MYHRKYSPQHPLVVTLITRIGYGLNKSTCHQGDDSFMVSVHLLPSCTVVFSPSLAFAATPPRTVEDWLVGLRTATFIPENWRKKCLHFMPSVRILDHVTSLRILYKNAMQSRIVQGDGTNCPSVLYVCIASMEDLNIANCDNTLDATWLRFADDRTNSRAKTIDY